MDAYTKIYVPDMDSFDSYDSYEESQNYVDTALAPERRKAGLSKLQDMENFITALNRKAEIANTTPFEIMKNMIANTPEAFKMLQAYVYERDYQPANNFADLFAQVNHARNEQIAETQEHYDPLNFDEVNNLFGSKQRKTARKERRQAKFERRKERRTLRADLKKARLKSKIDAASSQPEEETTQAQEDEGTQVLPTNTGATLRQRLTSSEDAPSVEKVQQLENPTADEAHAEIIGEEMEGNSYVGADDYDTFLPFLAGAIQVGGDVISGAKNRGADFSNIKTLFKKRPDAKAKANADKIPPAKMPEVLNKGISEIVKGIEAKKKQDFLKDNMIWIVLAVVVVFIIGKNS